MEPLLFPLLTYYFLLPHSFYFYFTARGRRLLLFITSQQPRLFSLTSFVNWVQQTLIFYIYKYKYQSLKCIPDKVRSNFMSPCKWPPDENIKNIYQSDVNNFHWWHHLFLSNVTRKDTHHSVSFVLWQNVLNS